MKVTVHLPARGTPPGMFSSRWNSVIRPENTLADYHEPMDVPTVIRGAPDGLTESEGGVILSEALRRTNIGFSAERGVAWTEIVSKLSEYGLEPTAPGLGAAPSRKGIGAIFDGIRGKP